MRNIEPYPKEERKRIIDDYLQSGLTPYMYCKRPEVSVSDTTLNRWLNSHDATEATESEGISELEQLGMVCYRIAESNPADKHRRLTLEEMVSFHQQVYDCCSTLQEFACTAENAAKVKYLMEVL